jgi:hypothetical protein
MRKNYLITLSHQKPMEVDFQKVYDKIVEEYPSKRDNIGMIADEFGDNFHYYITNVTDFETHEVDEIGECMIDEICDDFWEWLQQNSR